MYNYFKIRPNLGFWRQLVDYEMSLFGTSSVKIIPSSIGFIPDLYEAEVKNMQWSKNVPMSHNGQMISMPPIVNQNNTVVNNNFPPGNNLVTNSYNNYKERLKGAVNNTTTGNFNGSVNNNNSLQPIVGNAIPKFSRNTDAEMLNEQRLNNKSHYTTTYRSSYQKP